MSLTYRTYLFLWVIMSHYALMGIKHPKMHYMVKHKGRCMMPQLIWVELYFCLRDTFYKQTRCNTKCTDTAELDFLSCNSYLLYNSVTGPLVRHINILLLLLSIMLKPSSVYLLQLTQEPLDRPQILKRLEWWWWLSCQTHINETETNHSPDVLTVGGVREVGYIGGSAKATGPKSEDSICEPRKWATVHMDTRGGVESRHVQQACPTTEQTGVCPAVAGLGAQDGKYSQNQVSRCHTHSGTGNWHNVR